MGPTDLTRRAALRSVGLAAAAAAVTAAGGCGTLRQGFSLRPDAGDRPEDELELVVWAGTQEEQAFRALADGFAREHGGRVTVTVVPFSQALTTVDTGLRTGAPPDVFRVTYSDVGPYRSQGVLAELPQDVAARLQPQLGPSFWGAVTDAEGTFGVPHQTDTTMILVNDEALAAAGVRGVPQALDDAWTWDELSAVGHRLRESGPPGRYPMAVNWQLAGASRWLTWVDQAGGRLLTQDLARAVPPDAEPLRAAMSLTRGLFREGLVPRSMSTKSGQYTDGLFLGQQVAMGYIGSFTLPALDEAPFSWTPTFLQRQARASADLGGNALVAVDGPRREMALAFLEHCVGQEQQAAFCALTNSLPTRTDLPPGSLTYPIAPEAMALYAQQAEAITTDVVEQVTIPQATGLNRVLVEQLEVAFLAGASLSDAQACEDLTAAVDAELAR